jgi:hypothetical protein
MKMGQSKLGFTVMNKVQGALMDYMYNVDGNPYTVF